MNSNKIRIRIIFFKMNHYKYHNKLNHKWKYNNYSNNLKECKLTKIKAKIIGVFNSDHYNFLFAYIFIHKNK